VSVLFTVTAEVMTPAEHDLEANRTSSQFGQCPQLIHPASISEQVAQMPIDLLAAGSSGPQQADRLVDSVVPREQVGQLPDGVLVAGVDPSPQDVDRFLDPTLAGQEVG
jgi:hypothetical protein